MTLDQNVIECKTEFTFDELSPEARDKAVEGFVSSLWDDWHSGTVKEWQGKLVEKGFSNPEIQWSGFWSQGDGASFSCSFHIVEDNAKQFLSETDKTNLLRFWTELRLDGHQVTDFHVEGNITTSGSYSHENTMELEVSDYGLGAGWFNGNGSEKLDDRLLDFNSALDRDTIEKNILEYARGLAREIYSDLEKEYEYLTSEENARESSLCNDYKYDEYGNLI
jgi:hypothetical protein